MDIDLADTMPDGWQLWLDWHRVVAPDNEAEIKALEADRGNYLGYVRLVGRRQGRSEARRSHRVHPRAVHEKAFAPERGVRIGEGRCFRSVRPKLALT